MELFIVVIAILFVQVWGAENPLHKDAWFQSWLTRLGAHFSASSTAFFILAVILPMLILAVVLHTISIQSYWPIVPIGVLILLYSLGRGEFSEIVAEYTQACYKEDWESGIHRASGLGVNVEGITRDDWITLHQQVLEEAAYRGFERMFAVMFWFLVLGPVGALLYRLTFLFSESKQDNTAANKFLWLIEWPAVRVLGLSFAMTGNFVGCIRRWRESVLCMTRPTQMTIGQSVLGALSVDDDTTQSCDITRKELSLMDKLYRRTLWFWLGVSAIIIIVS